MANSIERSLRLLQLLAANQPPTTVSEVAALLDTSVASASRMIQTLTDAGAIEKDEQSGKLRISLGMAQVGAAAWRPLEFRRVVLPALAGALPELNRPVNVGVPSVNNGIWLESVSLIGRFISSTMMGVPIPYHAATMGKAMLAFKPDFEVDRILSRKLQRYTDTTIVDPEVLRAELALIRDCGFAINRAEFRQDGLAIAVPLINSEGRAVASFSVPASQDEIAPNGEFVRSLAQLGRSISQLLGYAEDPHDSFV